MWHAENIYEIPISFFKDNDIEAVIFDLDNTLDPPLTKEASKRTKEKIEEKKKRLVCRYSIQQYKKTY